MPLWPPPVRLRYQVWPSASMVCPGFRLLAEEPEWQAIQSSFQRQSPSLVRPQIGQGVALQLEVRWRIAAPGLTLKFCLWKGVGATLMIGFDLLALAGHCPEFAAPPAAGVFSWVIDQPSPAGRITRRLRRGRTAPNRSMIVLTCSASRSRRRLLTYSVSAERISSAVERSKHEATA